MTEPTTHIAVHSYPQTSCTQLHPPTHIPVCSYTPSITSAVVRFTNEATQEYTFYELDFTAGPPPKQGSLALKCPVRTTTTTRVAIRNPLETGVVVGGNMQDGQVTGGKHAGRAGEWRETCRTCR